MMETTHIKLQFNCFCLGLFKFAHNLQCHCYDFKFHLNVLLGSLKIKTYSISQLSEPTVRYLYSATINIK